MRVQQEELIKLAKFIVKRIQVVPIDGELQ